MLPYEYLVFHRKEKLFFKVSLFLVFLFIFLIGSICFPYTIYFQTFGIQENGTVQIFLEEKQLEYLNHPIFLEGKKAKVLTIEEEYPNFYIQLKGEISKEKRIGVVKIKIRKTTLWKEMRKFVLSAFRTS